MVTRKPLPVSSNYSPATWEEDVRERFPEVPNSTNIPSSLQPTVPSMTDAGNEWEEVRMERQGDIPALPPDLKIGEGEEQAHWNRNEAELPSLLRVGGPGGRSRSSFGSQSSGELFPQSSDIPQSGRQTPQADTNPFHRPRGKEGAQPHILDPQEVSSVDIWAELDATPLRPLRAPPPPPPPLPFQDLKGFAGLSLSDNSTPQAVSESEHPQTLETAAHDNDALISFGTPEHYQTEFPAQPASHAQQPSQSQVNHFEGHSGWTEQSYQAPPGSQPADSFHQENFISSTLPYSPDQEPTALPQSPFDSVTPQLPSRTSQDVEAPPALPPRSTGAQLPSNAGGNSVGQAMVESPEARATRQRSETYHIKHITWTDSHNNSRTSPIMVQNANGPCPLLALVNALTLSTPMNGNTALVETLRVREQVSLGLLLDAVFDELMSGRRGDSALELPDVGELYTFLITLHTGMNVNPCFVTPGSRESDLIQFNESDAPLTTSYAPPPSAGGFEETKEMKLYSTFSIPLIHGWLPQRSDSAYLALERSARTYEDAQNLMFREEELEDKLHREGLSSAEQRLLEDIFTIKAFLSTSATQLTPYGLSTITDSVDPGAVAILFRNDHFSTLYRHPTTGQLLTLVTDMGYAGHDEVVWESLVDVSGEGSSFFAGDFRPVGNNTAASSSIHNPNASNDVSQAWTTVTRRGVKPSNTATTTSSSQGLPALPIDQSFNLQPSSPSAEQQDHDLALALQLQEEEEDRQRRDALARQRENDLSAAYLSSQAQEAQQPSPRSSIAARAATNRAPQGQNIRPMVPLRSAPSGPNPATPATRRPPARIDPEAGEDAPPPSYEQAAKSEPYIPPPGAEFPPVGGGPVMASGASSTTSPPVTGRQGVRPRQMSAYSQHASSVGHLPSGSEGRGGRGQRSSVGGQGAHLVRRRSSGLAQDPQERDKDCVVM